MDVRFRHYGAWMRLNAAPDIIGTFPARLENSRPRSLLSDKDTAAVDYGCLWLSLHFHNLTAKASHKILHPAYALFLGMDNGF